jgi:hypothetical protein
VNTGLWVINASFYLPAGMLSVNSKVVFYYGYV